jgi:hypothetical protein
MNRYACVSILLCASLAGCALEEPGAVEDIVGEAAQPVSVPPYTVRLVTIAADGGPSNVELTANSQVQPGTVYFVRITVSGSPATFRATGLDGFERGTTSSGQFVPSANQVYQQDGGTGGFMLRTLSSSDFVVPLFMRLSLCNSNCANPGGGGWGTAKAILFPAPS